MGNRFHEQDDNPNAWVGVREGFDRDSQSRTQEFLVVDKETQEKNHFGFNINGDQEVFNDPWHR